MLRREANIRFDTAAQRVYEYLSVSNAAPRSFLYFVVANVGPGNSHRPLAITLRRGNSCVPDTRTRRCMEERVIQVIEDCVRIFDILTEPSNRTALEAKLSLAASWYQGPKYRAPDRVEVPDLPQPHVDLSWDSFFSPQRSELPDLPWASGIREFPFISTCLRMALNRRGTRLQHVQEQPLGTVFTDNTLEYGMVVFDISGLSTVRYGIVGSHVKYMAEVDITWLGDWDCIEGPRPNQEPVPVLEEPRRRVPLTAAQYMKKFFPLAVSPGHKALDQRPIVSLDALTYVWPTSDNPSDNTQSLVVRLNSSRRHGNDSLDQTMETLTERITGGEGLTLDTSNMQQSLLPPEFQSRLLSDLRKAPLALDGPDSFIETLRLAYAGQSHLNWVSYGNLTYERIAVALQSDQLKGATVLSLCIDNIAGSPDALFDVLVHCKLIHEISFLQQPTRESDELCSQLFTHICASPSGSALLQERNIFLTCAYSAPLQRRAWFPDIASRRIDHAWNFTPPVHAFPVQHMFVRQQFVASEDPKVFRPCYFFLGDALLDAERFAIGFLEYCCSVLTDSHLFSFSSCPPTLASRRRHNSPGMRISPIAAENLAIPRRINVVPTSGKQVSGTQFEFWPLVRDFEPGGWTVLVSHEWYVSPEVDRRQPRPALGYEAEVPFIRYAFVRTRQRINANDETIHSSTLIEERSGPDYVEVIGGLVEFLQDTVTLDDSSIIIELIEDATKVLKDRWPTGLGPGMSHLSVLDESDARTVLGEFIKNIPVARENLRQAMELKPEGMSLVARSYHSFTTAPFLGRKAWSLHERNSQHVHL
ncbi:hypothetical protein F4802DRAFT_477583 [Xylaria palmicola]|nr:hypothetical protein F4802DRAFT_477583 [Xylaria palmicola]